VKLWEWLMMTEYGVYIWQHTVVNNSSLYTYTAVMCWIKSNQKNWFVSENQIESEYFFLNWNALLITHANRAMALSAWVGCLAPSVCVCLYVRSITQKRKTQTWYREWSWDIQEVTWFWGWKIKGQGHRVNKCTFMAITPMLMHIWLTTV